MPKIEIIGHEPNLELSPKGTFGTLGVMVLNNKNRMNLRFLNKCQSIQWNRKIGEFLRINFSTVLVCEHENASL